MGPDGESDTRSLPPPNMTWAALWSTCGTSGGLIQARKRSRTSGPRSCAAWWGPPQPTRPPASISPSTGRSPSHRTSDIPRGAYTMKATRPIMALALLAGLLAPGSAFGQTWTALTYQPAQPLGNTQDFADNFAWRGIGLDFKKQVREKVALGISLGWQVFENQTDEV